MPVTPQTQKVLDAIAELGFPQVHQTTPEQARINGARRRALTAAPPEPIHRVDERTVPGPGGDIPVRVYTPGPSGPYAVLVYFHGGGWVIGDLESHDPICRQLAKRANCVVVSVHYRLAPEHRYPAAVDDCYAATAYVAARPADFGGTGRLAVGGDSAGGNLAAVVSLMARERGRPTIDFQLLIYPVTEHNLDTPSYHENAEGYMLWRADMAWFWDHYLPSPAAGAEPYASPLRARDLSRLPPALVITAEYDPLRDEGEAYAKRLEEAGVPVELIRYPGLIHGFFGMFAAIDDARNALEHAAERLKIGLS